MKDSHITGRTYWRSLQELAGSPEFLESLKPEFALGADLPPVERSRRRFLQLMAASIGLAGISGCRWPKEKIYPHANRPDNTMPGIPIQFATYMDLGGVARGLLATSYDGRPIKIDGNDLHPENRGANDILSEASVLGLYDPDRSRDVVQRVGEESFLKSRDEFLAFARDRFGKARARQGKGLAILSESSSSPSFHRMRERLLSICPQARWYEYEPLSRDNEREGTRLVFGKTLRPQYAFSKARVVLSLDGDFLSEHPAALAYARDFTEARVPENGGMNRLYAVESGYSLTGAMADHRFPTPSSHILPVVCRLAAELLRQEPPLAGISRELATSIERIGQAAPETPSMKALVKDLLANQGRSLVVAGYRQPQETHALVHLVNAVLGNLGETLTYSAEIDPTRPTHLQAISDLSKAMAEGQVSTLVILGGNPVYNAPVDLDFANHLQKVETTLHLSPYLDETSQLCTWHVPQAHYLETWGDGRAYDGTLCAAQPLIQPLYGGKSAVEFLSLMTEEMAQSGYDIVRATVFPMLPGKAPENEWRLFLDCGILENSANSKETPQPSSQALLERLARHSAESPDVGRDNLEVVFRQDPCLYDGRFANNGWLQELPEFLTKLTWDNAALVAPATAEELGLRQGELARLKHRGRELEAAVYLMPGQAPGSISLFLGYGRTASGRVGTGVGFNTYLLRTSEAMDFDTGLVIEPAGKPYTLACTQDHHTIDPVGAEGRDQRLPSLVREADLSEFERHPDFAKHVGHHPPAVDLWKQYEYNDHRWGMAIDLQKCIGCNACVVACQAENNIPVVGKEQVARQREMHWIRVDRYFQGSPENPEVLHQPVACVHCENAPCEQVCPVGATVHDRDGLNVMVYNRCIGTRYCSNNCPYKVRRFNFFHYHVKHTATEKMVYNPDVTIRARGVMEKCTFCVQRIERTKIAAKNGGRPIEDGEIRTACQVACPTQAIAFGDLNDPKSQAKQLHDNPRSYRMLEELHIKPRTAHLASVRNPNPELAEKREDERDNHS